MKAIEILQRTKQLLQDVGWCQGHAEKIEDGKVVGYCLVGAWYAAMYGVTYSPDFAKEDSLAHRVASDLMNQKSYYPTTAKWNDVEGRTKEQVIELLDQAIQQLS